MPDFPYASTADFFLPRKRCCVLHGAAGMACARHCGCRTNDQGCKSTEVVAIYALLIDEENNRKHPLQWDRLHSILCARLSNPC